MTGAPHAWDAPPLLYPPIEVKICRWNPWSAAIGPGRDRYQGAISDPSGRLGRWVSIRDSRAEALRDALEAWRIGGGR